MINGIHHIAIICSDYERSKRFYHELLGFPIIAEHYRNANNSWKLDLQINATTCIELFSFENAPERPSYPEARGLRHLCFGVEQLETAIAFYVQKGIQFEPIRIDEYTNKKFAFCSDPDGLPIELYEQ